MGYPALDWPYAAKAIIQHEFDVDHLNIWLTFSQEMNQTVKPANSKWLVYIDNVLTAIDNSTWQDAYTLLLNIPGIGTEPARVLVAYSGPDDEPSLPDDPNRQTLERTQRKQWEPFGPILSINMTD